MSKWVYIENGNIQSYHDSLPKNWHNVSGLNLSENNLKYLKSIGWFPVVTVVPSYDPELKYIKEYKYKIRTSDVVATAVLEDIPPPSPEEYPSNVFDSLREERNIRLLKSDWTQLADIQQIKDEQWKTEWSRYRQALRDITLLYPNQTDKSFVSWPDSPDEIS